MARFVFVLLGVAVVSQSDVLIDRTKSCAFSNSQPQCKPCLRPPSTPDNPVYNKPADVTNIELERSEVRIKKRDDPDKPPPFDNDLVVEVNVTAEDPEQDVLTYNFTISGGRIVGTGKKVLWNLNGLPSGTYTITAGVDDGCGVCGKTMTQSVVVIQD